MLPIVACTTFGFQQSAVSCEQKMFSMPNQSAILMIVPRLPGSCTPSSARTSRLSRYCRKMSEYAGGVSLSAAGSLKTPNTGCGCFRKDTFLMSSRLSRISSATNPSCSRSLTIFGPSATNSPAFSLPFLVSSVWMSFALFFDITSQIYKKLSTRHV